MKQVNPFGPDKQPKHQAPTISSIDKSLSFKSEPSESEVRPTGVQLKRKALELGDLAVMQI